jgi:hypothetical protein
MKKRLDYVLDQLSTMDAEPNMEASGSVAAQLSIIKGAFKESNKCPVCCFDYDSSARIICDVNGPLPTEEFMQKCKQALF